MGHDAPSCAAEDQRSSKRQFDIAQAALDTVGVGSGHAGIISKAAINLRTKIPHVKGRRAAKHRLYQHSLANPCRVDSVADCHNPSADICALDPGKLECGA